MFIGGLIVAIGMNGRLELHRLAPETLTPTALERPRRVRRHDIGRDPNQMDVIISDVRTNSSRKRSTCRSQARYGKAWRRARIRGRDARRANAEVHDAVQPKQPFSSRCKSRHDASAVLHRRGQRRVGRERRQTYFAPRLTTHLPAAWRREMQVFFRRVLGQPTARTVPSGRPPVAGRSGRLPGDSRLSPPRPC